MVVRPTLLFGTDDYLEIADNALLDFGASDSFSALIVMRQWATSPAFAQRFSKTISNADPGYNLFNDNTNAQNSSSLADGVLQTYNVSNDVSYTLGSRFVAVVVRNVPGDTLQNWTNTTASGGLTDATTGSLASPNSFFVGRTSGATPYYGDMEVDTVAVFPAGTILNATTIGQIMSYLGVS